MRILTSMNFSNKIEELLTRGMPVEEVALIADMDG